MEPHLVSEEENQRKRKRWFIIFGIFLVLLALLWSVDKSVVYFLLAGAAFSLFKVLQLVLVKIEAKPTIPVEEDYETYAPSQTWLIWEDLKAIFKKGSSGPQTPQQVKVFVTLVLVFIGFIFFTIFISVIFGEDSSDSYSSDNYQRATDLYNNQQYDSAAYYYRLVLLADPENAELFYERGNAFFNANNTDSALVMYDQVLAIEPQHEQAQYSKASIYYGRKNYRQAIDETKKILEYNPEFVNGLLLIGDSFYNQSQLDSALQWYEGAYGRGYRSAILSHLMAYIYDVKGQPDKAINLYREAIGQDSTIVDIYTRLGELVPGEEGNWFRQKAVQLQQQ
jgi:predicted Zn-dependent protease